MTEPTFKITLAQLNPTVGDVTGNAAKARAARDKAKADGADLLVLPELFICGYPPEDLVLKPAFQAACRAAIEELARETAGGGPAVLIGHLRKLTKILLRRLVVFIARIVARGRHDRGWVDKAGDLIDVAVGIIAGDFAAGQP